MLTNFIPPVIIRNVYYSLFYSLMTYGIPIWGGGNITNISKIDKINRSAINLFSRDIPLIISKPLNFCDIYKYFSATQFHKYKINNSFEYFYRKVNALIPAHDHHTRFFTNNNYLYPPISKTVSQKQFLYNTIKIWNLLPQYVREARSNVQFKQLFKKYLLLHY